MMLSAEKLQCMVSWTTHVESNKKFYRDLLPQMSHPAISSVDLQKGMHESFLGLRYNPPKREDLSSILALKSRAAICNTKINAQELKAMD